MQSIGTLLSVLTPLVVVPLTVITFYLRAMREHQLSWHTTLLRRVDAVEAAVGEVRKSIKELEREYTTKEEWLRECMQTRRLLERATEVSVRIEGMMRGLGGVDAGGHHRFRDGT